jgi:hypothetical protein
MPVLSSRDDLADGGACIQHFQRDSLPVFDELDTVDRGKPKTG